MKNVYLWLAVVVVAVAGILLILRAGTPAPVACTMEAKLCPDGSYVGRQGPKCEFAECPVSSSTTAIISESGNMKVFSPKAGENVSRPLTIIGEGRTFENAFSFRLLDGDGKEIAKGNDMLYAPDSGQFGPFSAALDYKAPIEGFSSAAAYIATLEVFEYSAKDGSIVNNVQIPVLLSGAQGTLVKAYFSNNHADPNVYDCGTVFPVMRVVSKTTAVAKTGLEELLTGPKDFEKNAGFATNLPSGTKLNSVTIANGVAKADFSAELNQGNGGSCRVTAIRAQIEQTLKQFASVKSIVISVNGSTEGVLQP